MRNKLNTKCLLCSLVLCAVAASAIGASSLDEHETASKTRYNDMQDRLSRYAALGDEAGLRLLTAQLDAQLKLEDYLIKFREADHAKATLWIPILLSSILSSVVSVITTLLTLRVRK